MIWTWLTKDGAEASVLARMVSENFEAYRRQYLIAIAALIVISGTTAFSAWLMGPIVEDVFMGGDLARAYWLAGVVVAVFVVKGIMTYIQSVTLNRIGNNMVARFQRRVYAHLLSLGAGFFTGQHSATLVARINQNILAIREMLNVIILAGARDLLSLIGLIGVMFYADIVMSAVIFIAGPIALLTIGKYARRVKTIARDEVNLNAQVTTRIQETAHGIQIVKAFTMEDQMKAGLDTLTEEVEGRANKIAKLVARTAPLMETLAGFSVAGVIAYGGYRVVNDGYSAGNLASFMTALLLAYEPAKRLARLKVTVERQFVNGRMLYELLDTPADAADGGASRGEGKDLSLDGGEVVFDDVHFAYDGAVEGDPVLEGMSFTAAAGKTTALVGPSGGGKSTAVALLQRLYEPNAGRITIDGQDIASASLKSLREKIAFVSQSPILFQGTVRENLRYARPDATDGEIEAACRSAQAHDFITAMPQGYDTPLSEDGTNLSGGQRQRLSIARALVRNAPILLLDEATSALDNESEALVQKALDTLMDGRTTLVVAHRLSTIANADKILVIDGGRVADEGKHGELLGKDGTYAKLHSIGLRS
ncbi:MAG: ABC transporter ATP-binding protein, partial [Pseudomonadota bacterium]